MTDLETIKAQRDALLSALDRLLAVLPKPGDRAYLNHYARIEADEARAVIEEVRTPKPRGADRRPAGAPSSTAEG